MLFDVAHSAYTWYGIIEKSQTWNLDFFESTLVIYSIIKYRDFLTLLNTYVRTFFCYEVIAFGLGISSFFERERSLCKILKKWPNLGQIKFHRRKEEEVANMVAIFIYFIIPLLSLPNIINQYFHLSHNRWIEKFGRNQNFKKRF